MLMLMVIIWCVEIIWLCVVYVYAECDGGIVMLCLLFILLFLLLLLLLFPVNAKINLQSVAQVLFVRLTI